MLAFDVLFLGFLGYYLDQVLPKQYGVAKPWNFICVRANRSQLPKAKINQKETAQAD